MLTTSHSLLDRMQQPTRDGAAWDQFVTLYTPLFYRWVRKWSVETEESRDVIQEILLILLRELPNYRKVPGVRFRSWLWAIVRNRVRTYRRNRLPQVSVDQVDEVELSAPECEDERETAEEFALLTRRAAEMLQNDFEPTTWKAFWETGVVGRPGKEVALELNITLGAVYAARFRVQQRIRDVLGPFLT